MPGARGRRPHRHFPEHQLVVDRGAGHRQGYEMDLAKYGEIHFPGADPTKLLQSRFSSELASSTIF